MLYNVGISADERTVAVTVGSDALPGGYTDLGTIDEISHIDGDDDIHDHSANHTLFHHVRDLLYKSESGDAAEAANYPNGIYNMQNISIVRSGLALVSTSITAVALSIADAATGAVVAKWQPANTNATNTDFDWESDDELIATVSTAGVVTGEAAGECVVTGTHKQTGMQVTVAVTIT